MDDHLTNKKFRERLGEMRQRMQEVDECRLEFQSSKTLRKAPESA
jgi:hypothetical protein